MAVEHFLEACALFPYLGALALEPWALLEDMLHCHGSGVAGAKIGMTNPQLRKQMVI